MTIFSEISSIHPAISAFFVEYPGQALASKPRAGILDFQNDIRDRVLDEIDFLSKRQAMRRLGWHGLDALRDAIDGDPALSDRRQDESDAEIDAAIEAAHTALTRAKSEAEHGIGPAFAIDQCAEIETSNLRSFLRSYEALEDIRRALRDGFMSDAEAWRRCAEIAFETPSALGREHQA